MFVGHHLNIRHGLTTCADYARSIGANFFQIFLSSPQQFNGKRQTTENIQELAKKIKEYNMKVVVHANYMLNFCNPEDSYIHKQAVKLLQADLTESVILGAVGVVVHMGKKLQLDEDVALTNYVKGIKTALNATPDSSIIIFETGAGQGSEICTSLFGLHKLHNSFSKRERRRIKFCIDTCHIFSAGYNIGDVDYVDIFEELVESTIGWKNVACIHFNDSKCVLSSRKDRHADISKGLIRLDGLKKFFILCCSKNVPIVLETPCEDGFTRDQQITLVKSWI
jgi:apurinic endonuclease APN1